MAKGRTGFFCLCALFLVLGEITSGTAADWAVLADIETKGEYNSNLNASPRSRLKDYILSATPNVSFSYNTELTQLKGMVGITGMHYITYSHLDKINQRYLIDARHQAWERIRLNLGASFISDSTLTEELIASGTMLNRSLRNSYSFNPGFTYSITERLSSSLGYNFNMVEYEDPQYRDFRRHGVFLNFDYLWDEKTTLKEVLIGNFTEYDTNDTISSLGVQVGFNRKFSENWDATLLGGANYTKMKSSTGVLSFDDESGFITFKQATRRSSSFSPFFTLSTTGRWQTGDLTLSYSRSESASAYGNLSQYNNFDVFINQRFTEKLTGTLRPYFHTSTLDDPGSNYNSQYIGIRPGLKYNITERLILNTSYGFAYRSVSGNSDYNLPVHSIWLSLNYTYPIHAQY
ncbi:transporter [Desulfobacca acetoxidans]|uniref:PEP-CTERM system associated protein n=1 Tax=Desulfobacca acetoxidans (strain ATCC 700848 / DSM 11109 / ASRB2) TaxID=880072 RepID=F2NEF1_DESAR|nr:transporter [Desulfobacca acetoxidans]AEB08141.1 hypothetical protein Desac_0249 [Desulfobacca acetoxidans DSM 11109]